MLPAVFRSRPLLLVSASWTVALPVIAGCDKLALRENVRPFEDKVVASPPEANQDSGTGFVPSLDAGPEPVVDAGPQEACGPGPDVEAPFSKPALLASIAACTARQYCLAEGAMEDFAEKAAAYREASDDASLAAARNAWYFANIEWQVLEMFRFGPAAAPMEPAGQGLRDLIYGFPNFSRCSLEEELFDEVYLSDLAAIPSSARGFAGAEFLLFYQGTENACSRFHGLNNPAPGKWASLSAEQILQRKQAYLAVIAADIDARLTELIGHWAPNQANFASELTSAGHGSSVFATEQAGLNAVSNALFYMDKELKDWKVGRPAALYECQGSCAGYAESLYARVGGDNVRANLKGFRLLFQGCGEGNAGLGFDDWLRAMEMGSVADEILNALDAADATLHDFDLDKAFREDPSRVVPVHEAIKAITDVLKSDFLTVLDLSIPMSAEGDND